jgi:endoglucanase
MHTRVGQLLVVALVAGLLGVAPAAMARDDRRPGHRAGILPPTAGPPQDLHTTIVPGQKAISVTWSAPAGLPLVVGYEVLLDGQLVATVLPVETSYTITTDDADLVLGHTYEVAVRAALGEEAYTEQTVYIAPVTTVQKANPSNPLAGREWGVYTGLQDQAYIGWNKLDARQKDDLALFAMIEKATYFGRWIGDEEVTKKAQAYIAGAQAGDPEKLVLMTLFRMFPWEGEARIDQRLPTAAEQASYRRYVTNLAQGIGGSRVAVVVQPDGYFVKKAFEAWVGKVGRKKALLPARMLAWTVKTLAAQPRTTVYLDMGSEDWARGDVASVAKYLRLSGVQYARGFSLNVSHKNYLEREIAFAQKVSEALARKGLKNKHAVLETSDNGQPFHGSEINPQGQHTPNYTQPGEIPPCRTLDQKTPCTALGVPPTTDVDNPAWRLGARFARIAGKYVDAYLWISRPWLPDQGEGGTKFSPEYASLLKKTWTFSPYFTGTP